MAHLQKHQAGEEGRPCQSAPPSAQIPAGHPPVGITVSSPGRAGLRQQKGLLLLLRLTVFWFYFNWLKSDFFPFQAAKRQNGAKETV